MTYKGKISNMWCLGASVLVLLLSGTYSQLITNETVADEWLKEYNTGAEQAYYQYILGHWNYNTNLTEYNQQKALEGSVARANFKQEAYQNTTKFDWRNFENADLKRQFSKVADIGTSVLTGDDLTRYNFLNSEMEMTYSTATVCRPNNASDCIPLDPDLTEILANSRDWDELEWAWDGWRKASGAKIKDQYREFVELQNKAATLNKFADTGDYWRSWYEDDDFEAKCLSLWTQVKPLYQQLHAYVKRKLKDEYKNKEFPATGHIPAHLLGNMWAQQWTTLLSMVEPYPGYPPIDVTKSLLEQNYTTRRMFDVSEDFFVSLGLEPMPQEFWDHSMTEKPKDGRKVVCHASAWDFYNGKDFRIKQCTDMTQDYLVTTHHEMGHIQYFLQYKELPIEYRDGANPGFHEAVGDVLSLSVSTPEHLQSIGLLSEISNETNYDINYLMGQALERIAFLPFGFLIDQWRWSVFRGETPPEKYNEKWWQLRCLHQGVSPPVTRAETDFDPGAKFHIPSNTPYIRYFVSFIIQFQFHKALCEASGHTGPLHRCDIYNNKDAGKKLGDMLKMGSSQPWPEAMEAITGQRTMDASALVEFFQPLTDWLVEENKDITIGWEDDCPPGSFPDTSASSVNRITVWLIVASVIGAVMTLSKTGGN